MAAADLHRAVITLDRPGPVEDIPDGGVGAPRIGRWSPDGVTAVKVWLSCVLFIPGQLVVPAVGAAGRPAVLVGCAFALWWGASRLVRRAPVTHHLIRIAILSYAVVLLATYAAGLVRGPSSSEALQMDRAMLSIFVHLAIALVVIEFTPSRRRLDDLILFLVYGGAVVSFTGLLQFFLKFDVVSRISIPGLAPNGGGITSLGSRSGFTRPDALSMHPIAYGVFMAFLFPIAVHYFLHATTRSQWRWRLAACAVIVIGVPISVSRSSVLVMVVSVAFIVSAWSPRTVRRSALVGVVGIMVFRAAVPSLLGTLKSLFTNLDNDPSISGRTDDYATVFTYINERPLLGRGPGTFGPADYILLDNDILGTIVMQGYLGLAFYLGIFATAIFVALRLGFRGPSNEVRHLGTALAGAITASAISMYFADMSFFAHWLSPTFLLIGIVGALDRFRYEASTAVGETDVYLKPRRLLRRPAPVA